MMALPFADARKLADDARRMGQPPIVATKGGYTRRPVPGLLL